MPHPVDIFVGSRVRMRRNMLGLSQTDLGRALGLTFQQVQKYERGANRIGSSRLYTIGQILKVPVAYFFDEMPEEVQEGVDTPIATVPVSEATAEISKRETLELVKVFYRITDQKVRRRAVDLLRAVAENFPER